MAEMRAKNHAELLHREAREAVSRYRAAKRDYEAVLNYYTEKLYDEFGLPYGARLTTAQETLARQRAADDPRQVNASAQCKYFMTEMQAFASLYLMERDWQDRMEPPQKLISPPPPELGGY